MSNIIIYGQQYVPAVYDDSGTLLTITTTDNCEAYIQHLIDGFITAHAHGDFAEEQRQEDLIKNIYFEALEYYDRPPTMDEMIAGVMDHNNGLITLIAEMDFFNDYTDNWFAQAVANHGGTLTEADVVAEIEWLKDTWAEQLWNTYFTDLDWWIDNILCKSKYAVYVERENEAYRFFSHTNVNLIMNDCQNLLNPEWLTQGMLYTGQSLDLERTQVVVNP